MRQLQIKNGSAALTRPDLVNMALPDLPGDTLKRQLIF